MSHEKVAIVEAATNAYDREDWDALFQAAAPGFELDMSRSIGPARGVYGLDQLRRFLEELADSFESVRIEPHEFIQAGDLVVMPQATHVRERDGIEVAARSTLVWAIRERAIERVSMYQEREDALEAVGPSQQDAHADSG